MLVVQKFGGSSVANAERVFNVAQIVTDTYKAGNDVVVVVSAQGDTTDDLIEKAKEINPSGSKREMDMLLAAGEQISISLLAMAIEKLGFPVVSLLGWQAGFQTNSTYSAARIKRVNTERIRTALDKKRIVVVAGFQGLNRFDDITTLGRGGSDTSAVAIAASMQADLCQIFTDVEGVYTADPRRHQAEGNHLRRNAGAGHAGRPGAQQPVGGNGEKIQRGAGSALQLETGARHQSQGGCENGTNAD